MLCLHGEPVGAKTTKNGILCYCKQLGSSCHFMCSEDHAWLYDKAVKEFLATKQARPKCCVREKLYGRNVERNYAKMKVVTDMEKESFGRPFFVCSKKDDPCKYFAWGDQAIIPSPLCEHGKPCHRQKEWKEGPNKGRYFFSCAESSSYIPSRGPCKFFKWMETEDERETVAGVWGEPHCQDP